MSDAPVLYTNETTPKLLSEIDKPVFTDEQLTSFNEDAREHIRQQEAYCRAHPPVAIWRHATVGSLTRDGGVVSSGSSEGEIMTSNGEFARMALVGDEVTYPDGSTALIVSGSGSSISHNEKGYALVGSQLSNGDKIIITPQSVGLLVGRDGVAMPDDFLIVHGRNDGLPS